MDMRVGKIVAEGRGIDPLLIVAKHNLHKEVRNDYEEGRVVKTSSVNETAADSGNCAA